MTTVQRLFDNRYTRPDGLGTLNRPMSERSRAPRSRSRAGVPFLVLSVVLLSASALGPAAARSPDPPVLAGPTGSAWASYSGHGLQVVFPTSLPRVELFQQGNVSEGASLQVNAIYELAFSGGAHPTVRAAAFPSQAAAFNGTRGDNLTTSPVALDAALDVHAAAATLWSSTGVMTLLGPAIAPARLDLRYAWAPSGTPGQSLQVNWTILGWPWVDPSDVLAVDLNFLLSTPGTIAPCSGAVAASPCGDGTAPPVGIAWDSSLSGLVGIGPDGFLASVVGGPSAQAGGAAPVPYRVGTFASDNASAELVLGAAAGGSWSLSGGLTFSLAPPSAPLVPVIVRGSAGTFFVAAAVFGGVALLGLWAYRRRERRSADEL